MELTKKKIGFLFNKYIGMAIFLLLWQIAPSLGWLDQQFVPSLSVVLQSVGELWVKGGLFTHIMVSLWRTLNGLIAGTLIALPLGFILGRWFPSLREALNPLFRLLGQVNPFSLMPVFILFFGIGESAKIAVIAWVCVWPVLFHTLNGVKTVDPVLIKTAAAMNASRKELLIKVLLPAAAPSVFSGIRVGVEMSFFMLIAAEMIGASAGLGWLMHNSAMNYHIPRIYAASLCIVILGVILNRCLYFLQNRVFFGKKPMMFST